MELLICFLHQLHQNIVTISAAYVDVIPLDQMPRFFMNIGSKLPFFASPANLFIYATILIEGRIVFFIIWAIRHTRTQQLHAKSLLLEVLSLEIKKEGEGDYG